MITMMNTEQDYINQIKEEKDAGYSGKFIITFKRPVQLIQNRYHKKTFTSVKLKLFFSGNMLCYTFYSRTGYSLFRQINADDIVSIEKAPSVDKKANRLKQAQSLLRRIDTRCWDDIRNRTPEQISEEFCDSNLIPFNFIKRFRPHIQHHLKNQLIDAFENRKPFYYVQNGTKRDLSIETKVGNDGVFRAWFSSEYAGCLNGDYYLVISPTQAIYYERD
jgi:hypothetical protein